MVFPTPLQRLVAESQQIHKESSDLINFLGNHHYAFVADLQEAGLLARKQDVNMLRSLTQTRLLNAEAWPHHKPSTYLFWLPLEKSEQRLNLLANIVQTQVGSAYCRNPELRDRELLTFDSLIEDFMHVEHPLYQADLLAGLMYARRQGRLIEREGVTPQFPRFWFPQGKGQLYQFHK